MSVQTVSTAAPQRGTASVAKRGIWGWILFDWAAQPFFTVVTTFIFGPYFVTRLTDDPLSAQTLWSGIATVSALVVAVFSPVLGSIADQSGARKPWIASFAAIKIACLAMLWFAAPGSPVVWPVIFMVLAAIAAEFSIVFNDSMLPRLMEAKDAGRLSNLAWGLGYLGGMVVLIAVVVLLAADPKTGTTIAGLHPPFGIDAAKGEDARITGPIAAFWYLLFIIPMFLFTPDEKKGMPLTVAVRRGLTELGATLAEFKSRPALLRFLIARMIYQDGVNGIVVLGGIFAAALFGWGTMEMGVYGILLNVIGIAGCFAAGRIDQRIGSRLTVLVSLAILIVATIGIVSTTKDSTLFGLVALPTADHGGLFATGAEKAFLVYGALIGLAFGPVQASSRAFVARNVEAAQAGRYFGLYALSGRATSFVAPLLFTVVTSSTGSAHFGMATLAIFLAGGFLLLLRVPDDIASGNLAS